MNTILQTINLKKYYGEGEILLKPLIILISTYFKVNL